MASLIVALVLIGYHLGTPVHTHIMGRGSTYLISPELVVSLTLMPFAVDGFLMLIFNRVGKYCLLAFGGLTVWILVGAMAAPPNSPRSLVNPVGTLAIMCGGASLFRRYWPLIGPKLPVIIISVVGLFLLWLASAWAIGSVEASRLDKESGVIRYAIGGVLPTEVALFLVPQLCYLLFLLRFPNRYRPLAFGLTVIVLVLIVFVTGSRGAIATTGVVFCMFVLSRSTTRWTRRVTITALTALLVSGLLTPYLTSIQQKGQLLTTMDESKYFRVKLYKDLYQKAVESPVFGIGFGQYTHKQEIVRGPRVPHHNILGRACESGFPAAFLYVMFILAAIRALWVRRGSGRETAAMVQARLFIAVCLWIFVAQQFRGLFTDTWGMKEIYFVVGAGVGLRAWLESQRQRAK